MTSSSWKNLFLCIVGLEGCCVQQRCPRTCVPKCFCDSNLFCFSKLICRNYFLQKSHPKRENAYCAEKKSNIRGKLWAIQWSSKCEAVRHASLLHGLEGRCVQPWCVRTCVPKYFCHCDLFWPSNLIFVHIFAKVLPQTRKCPLCRKKVFSNVRAKLWASEWSSK